MPVAESKFCSIRLILLEAALCSVVTFNGDESCCVIVVVADGRLALTDAV